MTDITKLPSFAGVIQAGFDHLTVTGKAGGAMANGDVVETTDGLSWTLADTPTLSDTVSDNTMKGVVVFNPNKGTVAYATNDLITIMVWGMITCKAVGTAGITMGEYLQAGTGADAGRVRASTYASAAAATHDHLKAALIGSHVGTALSVQNGAADTLVWVLISP